MNRWVRVLVLLPLWLPWLLCTVQEVGAASPEERVQQALDAYADAQALSERGQRLAAFQRAESLMRALLEEIEGSPDLYANLGTAALQAEHLGTAVWAFRQALRLDPDHVRALQNVRHARTLLPAWVPRPSHEGVWDTFFFWHDALSVAEHRAVAAFSFLLAALGVAATLYWGNGLARNVTVLPALVWIGMVVSLSVQGGASGTQQGVIIVEEEVARAADSHNAPSRFAQALPGGTEVDVLERRQRWVKVGLANGRNAWVREAALGLIGADS